MGDAVVTGYIFSSIIFTFIIVDFMEWVFANAVLGVGSARLFIWPFLIIFQRLQINLIKLE